MLGRSAARAAFVFIAMSVSTSVFAAPVNLVTNGDFSGGNTGFTTQYTWAPNDGDGLDPGVYSIETVGNPWHPLFVTTGDHTTGNGSMFVANGKESPDVVWETTIGGLQTGTNYYFEAFLMNLCCASLTRPGPQLEFWANNVLLGLGATDVPGVWAGVSSLWNSGADTSVTLQLRNSSAVFDGNDFALDDIYLGTETSVSPTPVPEPASIFMLGAGLVGLARRMRRA